MQHLRPAALLAATMPNGRWQVAAGALCTPLLGNSLTIAVRDCPQLVVTTRNQAAPLSPPHCFAYRIDRGEWHRFVAGTPQPIPVPGGRGQVTIITAGNCDLDPVWTGEGAFALTGIDLPTGATWQARSPRPVATVIGDSITAGCWVAGKQASYDYRPEGNYLALASDQLGWPLARIAYSAAGFLRPGTGGVPAAGEWLTQLTAGQPAPPPQSPWLIVALGVNDRRFAPAELAPAVASYFARLADYFPGKIAVLLPFAQSHAALLRRAAARQGWPVIENADWAYTTTDGLHPDQAGSAQLGRHFAAALRELIKKG